MIKIEDLEFLKAMLCFEIKIGSAGLAQAISMPPSCIGSAQM